MKNKLAIALAISLTLGNCGCAAMKRHPVITAAVVAIPAALVIAHYTTHTCPTTINGYRYYGTPPCPNPSTYDPGAKRSR